MELITSAEEVGLRRGLEPAIKSLQRIIAQIMAYKLDELGQQLAERAHRVNSLEGLENLAEKLLDAECLSEVEKTFDEIELATKLN
jgi:hypothetical protein